MANQCDTADTGIDLDEIRIDPDLTESMLRIAAADGAPAIAAKLDDVSFMTRALRMAHEVMVSTTLAQSLKSDEANAFEGVLAKFSFSGKDSELLLLGRALLAKIRKSARLPDHDLPDSLLASRFLKIQAAL